MMMLGVLSVAGVVSAHLTPPPPPAGPAPAAAASPMAERAASAGAIQPGDAGVAAGESWRAAESALLTGHIELTSPNDFVRAGEAYFGPDGRWIVFQAVPRPAPGEEPAAHYLMYVARLVRDASGVVTGIETPIQISPPGSANTCGWFHPKAPWVVMFGSTLEPPREENQPGYQRGTGRYAWQFPAETELVTRTVREIWDGSYHKRHAEAHADDPGYAAWVASMRKLMPESRSDVEAPRPMFTHPGYDAEGSFSPNGRFVLYSRMIDPASKDLDIYIFDTQTGVQVPLVVAPGYDGGPFFSPDATWICYRSDRKGDNLLQLFMAKIAYDAEGVPTGIEREIQLTDSEDVNWCPFWIPSSRDGKGLLVYATSEVGHTNYEVFAIETDPGKGMSALRKRRVTQAAGFDGLPVFSPDGSMMMWTSQRGGTIEGEARPSSQIWVARTTGVWSDREAFFAPGDGENP